MNKLSLNRCDFSITTIINDRPKNRNRDYKHLEDLSSSGQGGRFLFSMEEDEFFGEKTFQHYCAEFIKHSQKIGDGWEWRASKVKISFSISIEVFIFPYLKPQ